MFRKVGMGLAGWGLWLPEGSQLEMATVGRIGLPFTCRIHSLPLVSWLVGEIHPQTGDVTMLSPEGDVIASPALCNDTLGKLYCCLPLMAKRSWQRW